MNSNFTLKDDEDLLSYDFCAESYLNEELNKSRNRTCGSSLSEVVHIFIQPSVRSDMARVQLRFLCNRDTLLADTGLPGGPCGSGAHQQRCGQA